MGCGREYRRRAGQDALLHRVVRGGLAALRDSADSHGGLPRHFLAEVRAFLKCGLLAYGFTRVRCDSCGDESLVAFSCKGRGLCPSCSARRAHVAAAHLVEDVLPRAPYRQWTLSFPFRLRWVLVKTPRLLAQLQRAFYLLVAARQRRAARRAGVEGKLHAGAVSLTQYFGSALQLTPHFHSLVPDGVFVEVGREGVAFVAVAPPTPEEVQRLAQALVRRARKVLERHGLLDADLPPEDGLEVLKLAAVQTRLPLGEASPPRALHGRVALVDGFSLHADTWVHENDRASLERLARYGLRGPLASSRLSLRDDGLVEYRLKRPLPNGATVLVLTPQAFLARLAALVPPPRRHLIHFHGGFAPNARVRPALVALARPSAEEAPISPPPALRPQEELPLRLPAPKRRPRLDWASLLRRTFALDVFTCARCGGARRVLAVVTHRDTARKVLTALGLEAEPPATTGPPRRAQLELPLAA